MRNFALVILLALSSSIYGANCFELSKDGNVWGEAYLCLDGSQVVGRDLKVDIYGSDISERELVATYNLNYMPSGGLSVVASTSREGMRTILDDSIRIIITDYNKMIKIGNVDYHFREVQN